MTAVVPFDWPLFLRQTTPSALFSEFAAAAAGNTRRQLLQQPSAQQGMAASQHATPDKEVLLHQAS